MGRFDVVFSEGSVWIDYHFCRENDCFGADETHGYSFDKAKEVVICHLKKELKVWRAMSAETWRRSNHPTEKEMYEDLSVAEDIYAMEEEAWPARSKQ